jgi:glycosyl hydrolase family 12
MKWHSRRPYRTALFISVAVAILLIGGFYGSRAFFSRSIASMPSAQAPAKSKQTTASKSGTPKTGTSTSPSPGATRSMTNTPLASLCGQAGWPEKAVDGGSYIIQNDEWNSTAPECLTTDGGAEFTVASSSIDEPIEGDPGGYPAIYSGCSSGVCTTGNKMPIQVSDLGPGTVTSNWATVQPRSGAYDVGYDIWFNRTSATSGTPDGGELMIWLAHQGGVAPSGAPVAHVTIDGLAYTIWVGPGNPSASGPQFDQITYVMDQATTSVHDLDVGAVAADAASRGYVADTSYLVNIQAGFEIWEGSGGLETKSFALQIGT